MAETTCAYCGEEVDETVGVEQDGLTFCSEDCADEYAEDQDDDE
ncbi:MAG: hypothetical protein ABR599_02800 [Gemmatimonadota bacterium]